MSISVSGSQITFNDASTQTTAATGFGFKNRIINGAMQVAQRGTSISSGTGSQTYTLDRWASFATGAAVNISQVAGIGGSQYALQVTGASSNTLVQLIQKIEQKNSYDLANQTVTLSFVGQASTATTVIVYFSYATVADNFNSTTAITSVSFNLTTSAQTFSTQVSIPVGATTGLQILYSFNSGLGSGVTATFTNIQLEKGSTATSFDYRPYGTELIMCQRYFQQWNSLPTNSATVALGTGNGIARIDTPYSFKTIMRATPTLTSSAANTFIASPNSISITAVALADSGYDVGMLIFSGTVVSGMAYKVFANSTTAAYLNFSSEL